MKRFLILVTSLFLALTSTRAQNTIQSSLPASLTAQIIHPVSLASGATTFNDQFWVCSSESMHLAVALPGDGFLPTLVRPSGTTIPWDEASTVAACIKIPIQKDDQSPITGYAYHFTLSGLENGRWTLRAQGSTPLAQGWTGVLSADFVSTLNAGLFAASHQAVLGQSIAISLAMVEGSTMRYDVPYTAKLYRVGDPVASAQSVSFVSRPSTQGGTPTLVATIQPSQPGTYRLVVNLTGSAAAGTFERSVSTGFDIYPQTAKITGQYTQKLEISFPEQLK